MYFDLGTLPLDVAQHCCVGWQMHSESCLSLLKTAHKVPRGQHEWDKVNLTTRTDAIFVESCEILWIQSDWRRTSKRTSI